MSLCPASSTSFEYADAAELVLYNECPVLGVIDISTANIASVQSGVILMNVGALRHIQELHAEQIQRSRLSEIADFVFMIVSAYEEIYEGTGGSILLAKVVDEHNAVVAAGYLENGIYRIKTAGMRRKRSFKNKKLLFSKTRCEPLYNRPCSD